MNPCKVPQSHVTIMSQGNGRAPLTQDKLRRVTFHFTPPVLEAELWDETQRFGLHG
jgi:hypothetical protein